MKVTLISSLPPHKGVTPYTLQLLDALARRDDVDVEAIGFRSIYPRFAYPGGAPENRSLPARVPVPSRRLISWWDPVSWIRAGSEAKGEIVHAQWWSWFLAPAYATALTTFRRRGRPVVLTVHNARPHEASGWKRILNSGVLRLADHLIVHAEQNRRTLIESGYAADRVSVVPLGAQAPEPTISRSDARAALSLPPDDRIVLLPGNLRPYKGARILAQAASVLRDRVPALRIVVAGELWKGTRDPRDEAREFGVEDLFDVRLGYLPDADFERLYAAADVVVLPYTHFDAQSAAASIALTHGRALIVSDTGGLPDLVRDPRAVVAAGDAAALATALVEALSNSAFREKLERDALDVAASFSWERVAERTVRVYREVLGAPHPSQHAEAA